MATTAPLATTSELGLVDGYKFGASTNLGLPAVECISMNAIRRKTEDHRVVWTDILEKRHLLTDEPEDVRTLETIWQDDVNRKVDEFGAHKRVSFR